MNKKELKKYIYALNDDIYGYCKIIAELHKRNKKLVIDERQFCENIKYIQFVENNIPIEQLNAIKMLYLKSLEK